MPPLRYPTTNDETDGLTVLDFNPQHQTPNNQLLLAELLADAPSVIKVHYQNADVIPIELRHRLNWVRLLDQHWQVDNRETEENNGWNWFNPWNRDHVSPVDEMPLFLDATETDKPFLSVSEVANRTFQELTPYGDHSAYLPNYKMHTRWTPTRGHPPMLYVKPLTASGETYEKWIYQGKNMGSLEGPPLKGSQEVLVKLPVYLDANDNPIPIVCKLQISYFMKVSTVPHGTTMGSWMAPHFGFTRDLPVVDASGTTAHPMTGTVLEQ